MSGISIVIVNYNVKYFIKQCLQSILNSDISCPVEIIVVDNASSDGSIQMIQQDFPSVQLIANKDNLGFGKANNQGFKLATQPYTLILNPDTILQEDTLSLCLDYMEQHSQVGALGVKMVDGSGAYLPESKRGFPTPSSSLFKLLKLSKLFPKSKYINSYYQGHLSEHEVNEIEVLTGAFMFTRTDLLSKVGGFDEDYFMYGEDIELSRQIYESGFKLVYFPLSQIIHFKGESTKKLSASYIKNFYGAMSIYAKKRNKSSSFLWSWLLNLGIILSAIIAVVKKLTHNIIRPLFDGLLMFLVTKLSQRGWALLYFKDPDYYSASASGWLYVSLVSVVVFCYYIFGQYDSRHNFKHLIYGFGFSSLAVLSVYSLLPSELRFSRLILLLLISLAPLILYLTRRLYNLITTGISKFNVSDGRRVAIVGSQASYDKIAEIVSKFSGPESLVGRIAPSDNQSGGLGNLAFLGDIVDSRKINELIFCSSDMTKRAIFSNMSRIGSRVVFKLANNNNTTILGSASKERIGEWYALDISFKIDEPFHRRTKRILNILFSIVAIVLCPLVIILSGKTRTIYTQLLDVLIGRKDWIGYNDTDSKLDELPPLRSGVFSVGNPKDTNHDSIHQENLWYARNYSTWTELTLIIVKFFAKR